MYGITKLMCPIAAKLCLSKENSMNYKGTAALIVAAASVLCTSAVYATGNVDAGYSPVTEHMSIRGEAGRYRGGEAVTLLLLDRDADEKNYTYEDIGYVEQGSVEENGNYNFDFKFDGNVNDYKLLMNMAGENINDTVKEATAAKDLFDISIKINKNTEASTAEAIAEIENRYGIPAQEYTFILAFYDKDGKLIGVKTEEARRISETGATEDRISNIMPDGTESIKAMLWDSTKTMVPICGAEERNDKNRTIVCWGDSLTAGTGGNGTTYPDVLARLSGREVVNMGVGGETATTIAARQGGVNMLVSEFTIPSDRTPVAVKITGSNGIEVDPLKQDSAGVRGGLNPCYINDVEGTLSLSGGTYYFTRSQAGKPVKIENDTPIVTQGMLKYRDAAVVIFIGTNGGWVKEDSDWLTYKVYMEICDSMIDYLDYNEQEYVIVGLTTGSNADRNSMDEVLSEKYGERFISMRRYLTDDVSLYESHGIQLSDSDKELMAEGKVPRCIRSDDVHFTAEGYTMIAEKIYDHMKSIGMAD